ncbi:MAG: hypothetical protein HOV97_04930 [Nonomuraea sp.]|nr:hypothetical protein [Nonomuraea sp.]
MTDSSLPTRSQVEGVFAFLTAYAGSSYHDLGAVEIEDRYHPEFPPRALHDTLIARGVEISERALQEYMETWLKANERAIIDYMIDSHCAVENPGSIPEKECPRTDAHGKHYWDESLFPEVFGPEDGRAIPEYHCDGIPAHPRCMIAGGRNADA